MTNQAARSLVNKGGRIQRARTRKYLKKELALIVDAADPTGKIICNIKRDLLNRALFHLNDGPRRNKRPGGLGK